MKFTFKANKPEGRYRSFFSTSHVVKVKGKEVGLISEDPKEFKWKIQLMVEEGTSFKWVTLKARFDNVPLAKEFLNGKSEQIFKQFKLRAI